MTLNTVYALLSRIRLNIIVYGLGLKIKVRVGVWFRVDFFKDLGLCDNNEHQS